MKGSQTQSEFGIQKRKFEVARCFTLKILKVVNKEMKANFKGMKTPLSMSSHITSEGPHRGILVPFQNGSHVPTVFPYLFPV